MYNVQYISLYTIHCFPTPWWNICLALAVGKGICRVVGSPLLSITLWQHIYYFHAKWTLHLYLYLVHSLGSLDWNDLNALKLMPNERSAANPTNFDLKIFDSVNDSSFPRWAISISNYTFTSGEREREKSRHTFISLVRFIISFHFKFHVRH